MASTVRERNASEVLLPFLRAAMGEDRASAPLGLSPTEIDWPAVLEAAERHGVRPLLYRGLTKSPGVVVAAPVLDDLRAICTRTARHNLLFASKLIDVLAALEGAAIPAFTFKGPVLATSAYGSLSLREFVDLDVMVHRKDLARARDGLRALGYTSRHSLNRAQEDIIMRLNGEYDLISEDRTVPLDLHWAFTSRYFPVQHEPQDLWDGLACVPLGSAQVRTLPPSDLLIVLCLHGSKSCWVQLKMIYDVAQVTRQLSNSDWAELVSRANAWGAEPSMMLGLALAQALLGAWLPDQISAAIARNETVTRLVPRVTAWMMAAPGHPRPRPEEARLHAALSTTTGNRLRVWAGLLLMPTWEDAAHLMLTRRLSLLYYVVRPFRLLLKLIRHGRAPGAGPQPSASGG